jgi:hypothetical protein
LVAGQTEQSAPTAPTVVTPSSVQKIARPTMAGITILQFCRGAGRSVPAIMEKTGFTHRTFFKTNHLDPLVEAGWLRPTKPDNPRHPDQGYVTTDQGLAILGTLSTGQADQPTSSLVTDQVTKPESGQKT